MFTIRKSIDIDFAHHIAGHRGACINIHGHTWKFEVEVGAQSLDLEGFVVDFKRLKQEVLEPCHRLLDHGLALGRPMFDRVQGELETIGQAFLGSRETIHGPAFETAVSDTDWSLHGAQGIRAGGLKLAVFPFSPTSERLAEWLYRVAANALDDERVTVSCARVYETLHPVESVAEYRPGW